MKSFIRFLNLIILLFSAAAGVLLFATPTFSFNSNIALKADAFSTYIPESEYVGEVDVAKVLGTKEVQVGLSFSFDFNGIFSAMSADNKNAIDEQVINKNIHDLFDTFYTPVNILTEYTVRTVLMKTAKDEMVEQIQNAITEEGIETGSTPEEILEECGITDAYFRGFAKTLYVAGDTEGVTVNSFSDVLIGLVEQIIDEIKASGQPVESDKFTQEKKDQVKNTFVDVLNNIGIVREDGPSEDPTDHYLYLMSDLPYLFLSNHLHDELQGKVSDPTIIERGEAESLPSYSERLVKVYVGYIIPQEFYQIVGYVSLGLFISLIVFAFIWGILFLITLIRTFSSRPWTIFGPWFWIIGSLQLVLGLGLTAFGKFILPNIKIDIPNLPVGKIILGLRTFALIPSIIYLASIAFAIFYTIFTSSAKASDRATRMLKPKKVKVRL